MIKKTKTLGFDLDVEGFVDEYGIVEDTSLEEIRNDIADYLCGCNDDIYYNFKTDDVYNEFINEILIAAKKNELDLVACFDEIVDNARLDSKLYTAAKLIRKKLIEIN